MNYKKRIDKRNTTSNSELPEYGLFDKLNDFFKKNNRYFEVIQQIKKLCNGKHSELRLPAETSLQEEHCSIGVYVRATGTIVELLILPYNPDYQRDTEKPEHETPEETLKRGGVEELELIPTRFELLDIKKIPNRKSITLPPHEKHVYLVWEFKEVEKDPNEESEEQENNEIGEPIWVPIDLVKEVLFEKHQRFIKLAIQKMAYDKNFFMKIPGEILSYYSQM